MGSFLGAQDVLGAHAAPRLYAAALHDVGRPSSDLKKALKPLYKDHRVMIPELRGHGDSPCPAGPWSIDDFASDVARLVATEGGGAVMLGIGLGIEKVLEFGARVFETAAQIGDPCNLAMKLWLDDELMQNSNTGKMIFSTAEQIAYLSERVTLLPGDIVLTGTPAGTGAEQDRFLRPGQTIRMWIENIGETLNRTA
jgi:pimeloyl-ACP methyl ester carboxylesterase